MGGFTWAGRAGWWAVLGCGRGLAVGGRAGGRCLAVGGLAGGRGLAVGGAGPEYESRPAPLQ